MSPLRPYAKTRKIASILNSSLEIRTTGTQFESELINEIEIELTTMNVA